MVTRFACIASKLTSSSQLVRILIDQDRLERLYLQFFEFGPYVFASFLTFHLVSMLGRRMVPVVGLGGCALLFFAGTCLRGAFVGTLPAFTLGNVFPPFV